jgi:CheY-like chemotaxis protein
VENAIKYTPAGEVSVRVAAAGPEHWALSVEDTGIGIPLAEHQRVFEEFYQLHNPERDRTRGLGLGLSIVRRLAQLLGIPIDLRSASGFGTRFELKVPRRDRAGSAGPEAARPFDAMHPGTSLQGTRVLVLDDEEAVRQGMETLLQAYGCEVRLAGSIAEALEHCEAMQPDIALVDLRLRGEENGIRAIERLRRAAWMPAILVSGDTAPDRIKEAHDAGIPLLHKPVAPQALYGSIEREVQMHPRSSRHGRRNVEWERGPA